MMLRFVPSPLYMCIGSAGFLLFSFIYLYAVISVLTEEIGAALM